MTLGRNFTIITAFALAVSISSCQTAPLPLNHNTKSNASEAALARTHNADDAWEVDERGALRHIRSGMTCITGGDDLIRFRKIVTSGNPQGDDARCLYDLPDRKGTLTLFATRYRGEDIDLELHAHALLLIAEHEAEPVDTPMIRMSRENEPTPKIAALTYIDKNGDQKKSSVWINNTAGWKLKIVATYPAEKNEALTVELLASLLWLTAATEVHAKSSN
jgi:hypothetical protein